MAQTVRYNSDRSLQVRRQIDNSNHEGCGDDVHALVGYTGKSANSYYYRSHVHFACSWAGMKNIVKIEMLLRTDTSSTHFSTGSAPKVRVLGLTSAFRDGVNAENHWTGTDYQWLGTRGYVDMDVPLNPVTGAPQDELWVAVDITKVAAPVVKKGIPIAGGLVGGGLPDYGYLLATPTTDPAQRVIFHSFDASGSTVDPYLLITYDPINRKPDAPTLLAPATTNVTMADSFEGQHSDPDLDPMTARNIVVYQGSTAVWSLPANLQAAGSDEVQTGRFSVPLSLATGALKLQTAYEWVAQTRDPAGLWSDFSPRRALRITSSAPSVVASAPGTVQVITQARFGGTYSDPEGDAPAQFHLQMQPTTGLDWTDPTKMVWDTGETLVTVDEVASKVIAREYAGRPIPAGGYTYRVQAQDVTGVWSAWSADMPFTLVTETSLDPGSVQLLTQIDRTAPIRVALYAMNGGPIASNTKANPTKVTTTVPHGLTTGQTVVITGSNSVPTINGSRVVTVVDATSFTIPVNVATTAGTAGSVSGGRAPGALIGYIDDPIDLGASAYMNGGGEMYFTLPALHPYCPYVEPMQTHYQVQQWYGDRYRTIFAGLITDFDADADTMVALRGRLPRAAPDRRGRAVRPGKRGGHRGADRLEVRQPDHRRHHPRPVDLPQGPRQQPEGRLHHHRPTRPPSPSGRPSTPRTPRPCRSSSGSSTHTSRAPAARPASTPGPRTRPT